MLYFNCAKNLVIRLQLFPKKNCLIIQIAVLLHKINDRINDKKYWPRYFGVTYIDLQKIYIDKNLLEDRKKQVLIHELTHCYISEYITHSEKEYNEEDVADINSNSFEIIRDEGK